MPKTKALISCAVTAQLNCVFVFACANHWFINAKTQIKKDKHPYTQTTEYTDLQKEHESLLSCRDFVSTPM